MVHYLSLPELKKALGENYSIRTIDLEKCLYRDFGNGFNVEISGCSRANRKCPATLYLWFGDRAPDCIIVKTVRDVGRSAEAIGEAVEKLYACSEQLLANGYADRNRLFCPAWYSVPTAVRSCIRCAGAIYRKASTRFAPPIVNGEKKSVPHIRSAIPLLRSSCWTVSAM